MNAQQAVATTLSCAAFLLLAAPQSIADDFQVCGLYLGENPSGPTAWSENVEGIAHDDTHWYIVQGDDYGHDTPYIWRIPVTVSLSTPAATLLLTPGVLRRNVRAAIDDPDRDYGMGDPVVYRYGGVDYLIVLTTYNNPGSAYGTYIIAFEASTLTYLDSFRLAGTYYASVGVSPQGRLYLNDGSATLDGYQPNWALLHVSGTLECVRQSDASLIDDNGDPIDTGGWSNGLEFTSDGAFLYFLTNLDLQVFDFATGRRVLRSNNGSHPLNLQFEGAGFEEKLAGLTLWDFQDGGQLHVVVRGDDIFSGSDAFLKHYTHVIHVNRNALPPGDGTSDHPFVAVTYADAAAWPPGCEVLVQSGVYPETLTIAKPMRLRSSGGPVRIGG